MNTATQQASSRAAGALGGTRNAVIAVILAVALVAAVILAYALATNGTFASAGTRSDAIPTVPDFPRGEDAPTR